MRTRPDARGILMMAVFWLVVVGALVPGWVVVKMMGFNEPGLDWLPSSLGIGP